MAIAYTTKMATNSIGFVNQIPVTVPAGGFSAGNHLVVTMNAEDGSTSISSVTDDASNSYSVHSNQHHGSYDLGVASGYLTSGLTAGQKVYVNLNTSAGAAAAVFEFSGGLSSGWFDKTSSGNTAFDVTFDSGLTATTTQADEMLFGAAIGETGSAVTGSPGGSYSELQDTTGSGVRYAEYRIVSATGTYRADGGWSTAIASTATICTFKASVVIPPVTDEAALRTAHTPVTWRT